MSKVGGNKTSKYKNGKWIIIQFNLWSSSSTCFFFFSFWYSFTSRKQLCECQSKWRFNRSWKLNNNNIFPFFYLKYKPKLSAESNHIKINKKFFAIPWQSNVGSIYIHLLKKKGRIRDEPPLIEAHSQSIADFDLNPFHENIIASGNWKPL